MNIRSLGILVGAALFLTAGSTPADLVVGGSGPGGDQAGADFVPLFTVLLGGNEVSDEGDANVGGRRRSRIRHGDR